VRTSFRLCRSFKLSIDVPIETDSKTRKKRIAIEIVMNSIFLAMYLMYSFLVSSEVCTIAPALLR
jgi:hypothetical protein